MSISSSFHSYIAHIFTCKTFTATDELLQSKTWVAWQFATSPLVGLSQSKSRTPASWWHLLTITNELWLTLGTLMPHSNRPLCSNTVTGILVVDGWAVTFCTARRGLGGRAVAPPSPLLAVPNVTVHTSTASVLTSYYSMWHCNYLCTLNG